MTLKPVKFSKPRGHAPRISPVREPGRTSQRYWSDEEKALIKKHYPLGGAPACLVLLPDRTLSGVQQQAYNLGVHAPKGGVKTKIDAPADLDDQMRAAWPLMNGHKRGDVNAFADRLGLPRWWITKRATKLGLTMPHKKEPRWTKAEDDLMKSLPLHDPDKCAAIFRAHGFKRSPTAIMVHSKRIGLSRRATHETYTATQAAKILGVDSKGVTALCIDGTLPAQKRNDKRSPQQGGSTWAIKPSDFRKYVIDHLERIDFRKVDKFEIVHLLTEVK